MKHFKKFTCLLNVLLVRTLSTLSPVVKSSTTQTETYDFTEPGHNSTGNH